MRLQAGTNCAIAMLRWSGDYTLPRFRAKLAEKYSEGCTAIVQSHSKAQSHFPLTPPPHPMRYIISQRRTSWRPPPGSPPGPTPVFVLIYIYIKRENR